MVFWIFLVHPVDVQAMNLRWRNEELDLSGQFHGRSFVKFKDIESPFDDFKRTRFHVYLNSGAL